LRTPLVNAAPGLSANYLHDREEGGRLLEVGALRVSFVVDDATERAPVLSSARAGITPLLSMLNTVVESGRKAMA
jgi:ferredoxin-NADP reductase